jgi:hypothetical protein
MIFRRVSRRREFGVSVLPVMCGVFVVAGCGSGSNPFYDQKAFGQCLRSTGATVAHLQGRLKGGATGGSSFSAHVPNAGAANFLDAADGTTVGEFVYFYAPADGSLARSASDWLKGLHEYSVSRFGNLVVATNPDPSGGLEKLIDRCRDLAVRKS